MGIDFIKKADISQINTLADLANELWIEQNKLDLVSEFKEIVSDENACVFIKYVGTQPVGFAQCQLRIDYVEGTSTSPVGYLEGIYIRPSFRSKGFAKELLTECELWAKSKGCSEFASDCELDNTKSFKFHLANGFLEANRIICFTKKLN